MNFPIQSSNNLFPSGDIKILLAGGTGFFGRALLRHLITLGKKNLLIYVLSRSPDRFLAQYPEFQHPTIKLIRCDITERSSLPWHLECTHVIHAAAESTVGPQLSPLSRFTDGINGCHNMLDLALQVGASRFLFTSSGAVYMNNTGRPVTEDCSNAPRLHSPDTAYGQSKRAAEHLCALYGSQYGLEVVIARCFSFVGIDLPLNVHFAIGNFLKDALYSDSIVIQGDGTPVRSYLDQRDLASWLFKILFNAEKGQTYNVGSDIGFSIRDIAETVKSLVAPRKELIVLKKALDTEPRSYYVPSVNKIRKDLALIQTISLSKSIEDLAEHITCSSAESFR